MSFARITLAARLFTAFALCFFDAQATVQTDYQLEKVVELSRHGFPPSTPSNREEIEAATQRP